jgi:hypothetical protein
VKQTIVGVYELGYEQVQLVLREDTGGEFYFIPEKGSIPRIKIGADYKEWKDVVAPLIHESMEFVLTRYKARYDSAENMGMDKGHYLFVIGHGGFSDCCAQVAEFIANCWSDLQKEWLNWNKVV